MKKLLLSLSMALAIMPSMAQRVTDKLDRGLVSVPCSEGGQLVSWRIFGEEYYDVTYNLYKDGTKIASNLKVSNYKDTAGSSASSYQVAAVVRGVEQPLSAAIKPWTKDDGNNNKYWAIKVKPVTDRNGAVATDDYQLNDISLADVNGDGKAEFIVKRPCNVATDTSQKSRFHIIDCYDWQGNQLWWIDLGPNMQAEADEQWDAVAYDWDGDGKAEVLMRGADNMIIHHADGSVTNIGNMNTDHRANGGLPYCSVGNEYLLYLNGETAQPYQIGPTAHPNYMVYPLKRGQDSDWGTGIVGHRSTKHFFGAPFLDGRKASIFLGRGIYTKEIMAAYDVDPTTHALTQKWYWECTVGGPWFGQGYHNYAIADVDWDGRDEIVYGSMVIDDNGKGLSTTGLGHGDAQHCSDLDPYRHGQEQFACNESSPNMNFRNATTSQFYYRSVGTGDDGRALCGNFSNSYPGCTGRSTNVGMVSCTSDKIISELGDLIAWNDLNFRIYWDGDLCEEVVNSPGTERDAVVIKPGQGRIFQSNGVKMCNWSKNNPCAMGDIIGDWREELILRSSDNTELRIYTTPYYTSYRNYTLWHDHQYRQGMVWECMGYNQPPHASYFLGEMEGITVAPPPFTMTGRTEVANGGTITNEDKHFIVCEPNDTRITITDGASPYMVTFNVPSWVQGTVGNNSTTQKADIKYSYFKCEVSGGAFTGETRVVKQGDGILTLPKVDMTYTGETNVWAGTLNFDGTLKQSPLWLNRFAELNSDGGIFKSITADYASIIRPGGADKIGNITVEGDLIFNFGSVLELDLDGSNNTIDNINANTLSIQRKTSNAWINYGPAYLQPVIRLKSTNLAAGDYVIGNIQNITGSLSNIKVEGSGNYKVMLKHENGKLTLTLGDTRSAGDVVWTGTTSNVWDFAKSENFTMAGDESSTPETFINGDAVFFDDTANKFDVSLDADIEVNTITFRNETKSYTISGTGSITQGELYKTGAGKVTINTDNTYTGGNHLQGGVVSVKSLSNDVLPHGNLGGVTKTADLFTIEDGATLTTTAAVTNGSPIKFVGEKGGVINNSADFVQQKAFIGTTLTKKGNGWLKTSVAGTSLNRLIIAAGTVQNGTGNAAKVVELQGGTIVDNGGTSNEINVPQSKTGTWRPSNRQTYTNKITGEGKLTVYSASEKGSGWVATRTPLKLNLSAFTGTLVAQADNADDGRFTFDTSTGGNQWTLNIPSGVVVQNSGKTLKIGAVTGSGNLGGFCSFSNGVTAVANTWTVGNDGDFKFEGKIISDNKFNKVGTGKMITTGAWETTGAVAINEGELHINSGSLLGNGTLTIAKGATLSGTTKTGVPLTNSSFTINGTVQVGITATTTSGEINFNNKNVTFNADSRLILGLSKASTDETKASGASIKNISKLTLNGTVAPFLSSTYVPKAGDELRLWLDVQTFAGTPQFELPDIHTDKAGNIYNITWDTSDIAKGIIRIANLNITDGISNPLQDNEKVEVSVHTLNGIPVCTFHSTMGDVLSTFRHGVALDKGVYVLTIKGENSKVVMKVQK